MKAMLVMLGMLVSTVAFAAPGPMRGGGRERGAVMQQQGRGGRVQGQFNGRGGKGLGHHSRRDQGRFQHRGRGHGRNGGFGRCR